MTAIHTPEPRAQVRVVDAYGNEAVPGSGDIDAVPYLEIKVNTIEAELCSLLAVTNGLTDALARMLHVDNEHSHRKHRGRQPKRGDPNLADGTVVTLRNAARNCLAVCNTIQTDDPVLRDGRRMLAQYVAVLNRVDVQRDSAPGIAIACKWKLNCYRLIRAQSTLGERALALLLWDEAVRKIGGSL